MGVVSLILKMISYIFEGVDTWFWKQKRKKERGGGRKIALNPTGTKVVFFSRFLLRLSLPLMFLVSFYSTRHRLCQFSVIRSQNCTLFVLFDS